MKIITMVLSFVLQKHICDPICRTMSQVFYIQFILQLNIINSYSSKTKLRSK